jgi:hypothetical protein
MEIYLEYYEYLTLLQNEYDCLSLPFYLGLKQRTEHYLYK